jgi:transposase-like protein
VASRAARTVANEAAATARFEEFAETWVDRYPAIVKLRRSAWAECVPFLTTAY